MNNKKIAITGAFSYSGKYIAAHLLEKGYSLITLTGHPNRPSPFNGQIPAYPFNFDDRVALVETLQGVDTLINTYWVRFDHNRSSFFQAISNIRSLFWAAKQAGVRRIIHISITNPDRTSGDSYFWGKALLEEDLNRLGVSYAILRPTVIFGKEDILINNIAWFLRRFPVFAVPGDGDYRLQPIYVDDLAELAVAQVESDENTVIEAIGPETYTFNGLLTMLQNAIGSKSLFVHTPPMMAYRLSAVVGKFVNDIVLTEDEVVGLMDDRLVVDAPPAGKTRLSDWVQQHADTIGTHYANEIARHFDR
jgi:NADH dehydrogenase